MDTTCTLNIEEQVSQLTLAQGALTIGSIALGIRDADDFVVAKTCDSSLAAGASCTVSVSFKPVAIGAKVASISIVDNATGSPQSVSLSGTGEAVTSAPAVKLSATSLAFGNETIGATSAAKSITVTNTGSATLTISSIALGIRDADDFLLAKTCGSTLSAGASCTITVSFKPVAIGAKVASISIVDNGTGSPQSVSLTGTGEAVTSALAVKLSATALAFGSETVGVTSASKSVIVTNIGTATLTINSIALGIRDADDFVFSKTCGASLAAGTSCTIAVSFKPVAIGAKVASISIVDNALGSPQTVGLLGTAVSST